VWDLSEQEVQGIWKLLFNVGYEPFLSLFKYAVMMPATPTVPSSDPGHGLPDRATHAPETTTVEQRR